MKVFTLEIKESGIKGIFSTVAQAHKCALKKGYEPNMYDVWEYDLNEVDSGVRVYPRGSVEEIVTQIGYDFTPISKNKYFLIRK